MHESIESIKIFDQQRKILFLGFNFAFEILQLDLFSLKLENV